MSASTELRMVLALWYQRGLATSTGSGGWLPQAAGMSGSAAQIGMRRIATACTPRAPRRTCQQSARKRVVAIRCRRAAHQS